MNKEKIFVEHIESHFKKEHPEWKACCKICGKSIDKIYEDYHKKTMRNKGVCNKCPEEQYYPDCDENKPCPYILR